MQVSCTITVSVDSFSVNTLEQAALEGAREAGKKLFQALLALAEKALPKEHICKCGGRLESRGRAQRKLMTIVGDIVFNRQKLCCRSCGKKRYPLDESLGIAERRLVAPGLRERALWLATEMSYEKAAEGARKLCGIAISEGTIKNLVLEEGSEVLRQKEQERKRVWEKGEDVVSGDGKKSKANPLLALRLLKINGEWEACWRQKGLVTVCPPNVCLLT